MSSSHSHSSHLPPPPGTNGHATAIEAETALTAAPDRVSAAVEWSIFDYDPKVMPDTEVFLPGLWKRMHDDGTFEMFYHEDPKMNFTQFGASLAAPGKRVQLVIGHDVQGTAVEHAGVVMLTDILDCPQTKRAAGNFMFFKEYWNRRDSLMLGHAVIRHWFEEMKFDVIVGVTPKQNRAAVLFIHRLGFQQIGEMPAFTVYKGQRCPAVVNHMTIERWRSVREALARNEAQNG